MDLVPEFTPVYLRKVNPRCDLTGEQPKPKGKAKYKFVTVPQSDVSVYVTPSTNWVSRGIFAWEVRVLCLSNGVSDDFKVTDVTTLYTAKEMVNWLAAFIDDLPGIRSHISRSKYVRLFPSRKQPVAP